MIVGSKLRIHSGHEDDILVTRREEIVEENYDKVASAYAVNCSLKL